jgi:hypothetical protein
MKLWRRAATTTRRGSFNDEERFGSSSTGLMKNRRQLNAGIWNTIGEITLQKISDMHLKCFNLGETAISTWLLNSLRSRRFSIFSSLLLLALPFRIQRRDSRTLLVPLVSQTTAHIFINAT